MTQEQIAQWKKLRALNERVRQTQVEMTTIADQLGITSVQFYLHGLGNMAGMIEGAIEAIANDEKWRH